MRATEPTGAADAATEAKALARYFRGLGDPTRVRILLALLDGERSVSELVELTGAPQSRVSNHLACLKWCRFVEAERRGRSVLYRVTDGRLTELLGLAGELASEHRDHLATCTRIGPDWV